MSMNLTLTVQCGSTKTNVGLCQTPTDVTFEALTKKTFEGTARYYLSWLKELTEKYSQPDNRLPETDFYNESDVNSYFPRYWDSLQSQYENAVETLNRLYVQKQLDMAFNAFSSQELVFGMV